MSNLNKPRPVIDPRLGSLLVSASGHLGATSASAPLDFGPPAVAGEVGTLGPYRVVRELGRGTMGAVFQAVDTRLDRGLALKVMLPELAASAEARERFLREARLAARINHDNVVTVYEADERDGVPYITMQLLQGSPLDAFLQKKGGPSLRHMVRIAREAALGLTAAHALGVVHRDIKPANLWLEAPHGRVKLLDFGLARPDAADHELTNSGAVVGTPAFMSPEQALGERVDHRTDLFSLGAVLYWLCTGRLPFPGPSVVAVLMALSTEDPTPVPALNPGVPPPLAELIHQLLAKDPAGRLQTAAEVANRLQEILEQPEGLSSAALAGTAAPSGAQTNTDPWLTRVLSGAEQRRGHPVTMPGEPNVLRSMPTVAITQATTPKGSQEHGPREPEGPKKEPEKQERAPGALRTVISSGVVWTKSREEGEEDTEAKGPDRPGRRKTKGRTRAKASAMPVLIGVGAVVMVAVALTAMLLVTRGKPKATDSVQQGSGDLWGLRQKAPEPDMGAAPKPSPPPPPLPDTGPAPLPGAGLVGQWTRHPVDGLTEVYTVRCSDGRWEVTGQYFEGTRAVGSFVGLNPRVNGPVLSFIQQFNNPQPRPWPNGCTIMARIEGGKLVCTWRHETSSGTHTLVRVER